MKKIKFGYSNSTNPTGNYEGIGIKPGLMLCDADYYGAIQYDGNNYIIAKVVEDEYNRYPQLLNRFIVRKALCDLYADGSCIMMLDQNENEVTQLLENFYNSTEIQKYIKNPEDIFIVGNGIYRAPISFFYASLRDEVFSTSIITEVFDKKNEAIKHCHSSVSELQSELSKNNSYTL